MLESLNDWTDALDAKDSVDVIYLDFQKAFDRVSHDLLVLKLVHADLKELRNFVTDIQTDRRTDRQTD
uniref:Reverse transcriptase domain-containing protein n=1 Tax=Haemonchus contortus TaxID=6289 RepID=A0A7I5EEN4_HAECO